MSCLRFGNENGKYHVSFVMEKSRIMSLNKAVTVPTLELTAATLATRVNTTIVKEVRGRLEVDRIMYWSDSDRKPHNRFVTFAASHVAAVRQKSP